MHVLWHDHPRQQTNVLLTRDGQQAIQEQLTDRVVIQQRQAAIATEREIADMPDGIHSTQPATMRPRFHAGMVS